MPEGDRAGGARLSVPGSKRLDAEERMESGQHRAMCCGRTRRAASDKTLVRDRCLFPAPRLPAPQPFSPKEKGAGREKTKAKCKGRMAARHRAGTGVSVRERKLKTWARRALGTDPFGFSHLGILPY